MIGNLGGCRVRAFPEPITLRFLSCAGCEECNNAHSSVCPKHGPLHPIPNRPVLTRARASLPLVLYIDRFLGGVFSKRRIPKRTQFGPVEGPLVRESELKDCYIHLKVMDACQCPLLFQWFLGPGFLLPSEPLNSVS